MNTVPNRLRQVVAVASAVLLIGAATTYSVAAKAAGRLLA